MGPHMWQRFIYPVLKRMYGIVRKAGTYVMIHSCGDVDELFGALIAAGVNCFNPLENMLAFIEIIQHQRGYKN